MFEDVALYGGPNGELLTETELRELVTEEGWSVALGYGEDFVLTDPSGTDALFVRVEAADVLGIDAEAGAVVDGPGRRYDRSGSE